MTWDEAMNSVRMFLCENQDDADLIASSPEGSIMFCTGQVHFVPLVFPQRWSGHKEGAD